MGKKILLADDSITIQKVIELTFSDEDFDVVTVGNGRLALERLAEVRPDIVLCDIIMPEKDGYEVCEQIKMNPGTAHIPVLLLTGAFEPFDQDRAAKAGYDGSLAKPFEPETLIAKVKDLLAKSSRPQAAPPPLPMPTPTTGPMPAISAVPVAPPTAAPVPTVRSTGAASFIPDEPFSGLDEGAFDVEPSPRAAAAAAPVLAPISAEESDTLSVTAEEAAEENAATVIFRPTDPAWSAPNPAAAATPATPAAEIPGAAATGEVPVFEAVLEEDLDFGPSDYPTSARAASAAAAPDISEAFSTNAGTLPPVAEVEEGTSGPFAALVRGEPVEEEPIERAAASTAEFPRSTAVEEELLEPEPFPPTPPPQRPIFTEEPAPFVVPTRPPTAPQPRAVPEPPPLPSRPVAAVRIVEPPVPPTAPPRVPPVPIARPDSAPVRALPAPEPAKVAGDRPRSLLDATPARPEPAPKAEFRPRVEARPATPVAVAPIAAAPLPAPAAAPELVREASFSEVAVPAEPSRPSEAAAVAVPADMVEKIAQRVIAQISEKIVREVAWEVIPDLAEALIKREIERLKAELAKI